MNVPDVIAPNLKFLFCGINPGTESARTGNHFAHHSNRFWKTLYESGMTPILLKPEEKETLLDYGYGIINLVDRPTPSASEVTREELILGAKVLEQKLEAYKPEWLAILGLSAYRIAFQDKNTQVGRQERRIGSTKVWLLPNPSGLNAHFTPQRLIELFSELRRADN